MGRRVRRGGRRGLQSQVLLGLALVMTTATLALVGVGLRVQEAQLHEVWPLVASALGNQPESPLGFASGPPGAEWWTVEPDGNAVIREGDRNLDDEGRALAEAARARGVALLRAGKPWEAVWFADPGGAGTVRVMRVPPIVALPLLVALVLAAVTVFTGFGATLLRGAVVAPLQRLSAGVSALAEGRLEVRIPEEGVAEAAEVASAFNQMAEALATRTEALEKAVADLRDSNRSLRAARDGLDRAERLAAVGQLASGVAHEVGNPMGALLAFLDLVGRDPGLNAASRGHLEKAREQGERVRAILRELLGFARPSRGEATAVDLVQLAGETVHLVRAQRRYAGIDFRVEGEGDPPLALSDRSALAQVLLNLTLNAADAVREAGGRVRLRVRGAANRTRAGDGGEGASRRRDFDAVELRVEDDGPGVAPGDRERIFDPFFTTKAPGEGTGLGLSNALRLAEQLGGRLDLEASSELGGAAFALRLPAVTKSGAAGVRGA